MTESKTIKNRKTPVTVASLERDLNALGVQSGMTLLVHSSLSSLGWVCGGSVAVILALENMLGPDGTLVMPAHSSGLSDPARWENPPVPEDWWEAIRETMPAFDPDLTPTQHIGVIPECFRKQKGVVRSVHSQVSFAAWGVEKKYVTENHALDFGLGNQSPLGKIYDLNGWVLLLGVDHGVNTSLHLAEYRADYPSKKIIKNGAPVMQGNRRVWTWFEDFDLDNEDFQIIGQDFVRDNSALVLRGYVGSAKAELFPQKDLVDYAVNWMEKNRRR